MTVKGFSRKNVSIYFYRFHLYSLCCRSQKLPIPSVSYMNPDVKKKKKGKMKQPANMSLYSECRGLAWSQALWEKCDYQTLAEDARKGRMTSVFPSCRISHDISCSEEHFIGSHKPLSLPSSPSCSQYFFPLTISHFSRPPSSQVFFQLPPSSLCWQPSSTAGSLLTWRCVVTLAALGFQCYEWAMGRGQAAFWSHLISLSWGLSARLSTALIV